MTVTPVAEIGNMEVVVIVGIAQNARNVVVAVVEVVALVVTVWTAVTAVLTAGEGTDVASTVLAMKQLELREKRFRNRPVDVPSPLLPRRESQHRISRIFSQSVRERGG